VLLNLNLFNFCHCYLLAIIATYAQTAWQSPATAGIAKPSS
jgi:hypothetical protein